MSNQDDDNDEIVENLGDLVSSDSEDEQNATAFDPYGLNQDNLRNEHGAVPIPRNFFCDELRDDIFDGRIHESKRKWEQFFWTKKTVQQLADSIRYNFEQKTCFLTTPSLAHHFSVNEGRDEALLDIDRRFSYLPSFTYFDLQNPLGVDQEFRLLILDPPFFLIPVEQIRAAVDLLTGGDFSTKIVIAWLLRAEKSLRVAFEPYNLVPTAFQLEYASIKPTKWKNFRLYSNIDLPGIKRKKE